MKTVFRKPGGKYATASITEFEQGFLLLTLSTSKWYKTFKGAERAILKKGYEPGGEIDHDYKI